MNLRVVYISLFFGFVLVVYFSIFSGFGKPPAEWMDPTIKWDGICGKETRLTMGNPESGKPVKKIALSVAVTKKDHNLNCRMWDTYDRISKIALAHFEKTNPTYTAEIIYLNEISETASPSVCMEKIKKAKEKDALIVVGNAWSALAAIDSDQANISQIPYVSPTAVVNRVHDAKWSVSLGVDVRDAAKSLPSLLEQIGKSGLIILESKEKIHEREYAQNVKSEVKNSISIEYHSEFPVEKIEEEIRKNPTAAFFIPGYTSARFLVSKILKSFPETVFIVGPQWVHDQAKLQQEFKHLFRLKLYCLSDYYAIERPMAKFVAEEWLKSGGDDFQDGLRYSLFDAITLALHALNDPKVTTRDEALVALKNFGVHPFSAKLPVEITDGKVKKPLYITKWEDDRFIKIAEVYP